MELKIRRADNGYIVSSNENSVDFSEILFQTLDDVDNLDEKSTLTDMFIYIADYFGMGYDGFSKENLNITWDKKGDEL